MKTMLTKTLLLLCENLIQFMKKEKETRYEKRTRISNLLQRLWCREHSFERQLEKCDYLQTKNELRKCKLV